MTIQRFTNIASVVRYWDFFKEGILYEAKYLRYAHPVETYRKILCHLVYKNPKAWVGVAFDDAAKPIAFVLAHDITPLFSTFREFEVSMFYFRPGNKLAIKPLQDRLDAYCKENGIGQYYITTSSFSSSASRVFSDSWQGLRRSNTVFKRKVS